MKKVLFPLLFTCLISTNILAQNKQGSLAIGGTLSLVVENEKDKNNNITVDGPKTTNFKIIPTAEYFISDKFSIGLGIGYDNEKTKTVNGNVTTTTNHGWPVIQPFARMYFPLGEKVSFFGQASVDIEPGKVKTEVKAGNTTTTTSNNDFWIQAGITPGLSLNLSDKVAIDATFGFIGYRHEKVENGANSSTTYNSAIFTVDPSTLFLGVKFFIF